MSTNLSSREFTLLQRFIEEQSGIVIGAEKAYFIESRLSKILTCEGLSNFEELFYKAYRGNNREFSERVIDAITTNETFWFRDKTPWYILEELLLPVYIKELQDGSRKDVRIWSSACSSGQEPYSIAMCIDNYLRKNSINNVGLEQFQITASDLSRSMVNQAISAEYDSISMERGLDSNIRDRYFHNEGKTWRIKNNIKNSVRFSQFNLKKDNCFFRYYDIIFCRYVLIYFSDTLKEQILQKMLDALKLNGVLFVGASEIISDSAKYLEVGTHRNGLFFKLRSENNR